MTQVVGAGVPETNRTEISFAVAAAWRERLAVGSVPSEMNFLFHGQVSWARGGRSE